VSDDLVTWARHPENPLLVDGYEARDPMVLRVGDRWVMYYTATSQPEGGSFVVAATESDDLVHWHGRTIVFTDATAGTGGGPTESPFVVERDGRYHLFIGPDWQRLTAPIETTGRYDPAGYAARGCWPATTRCTSTSTARSASSTPTRRRWCSTPTDPPGSATAAGVRGECSWPRSDGTPEQVVDQLTPVTVGRLIPIWSKVIDPPRRGVA